MVSSATITTTTGANFIPTEWAKYTLDAIEFAAMLQKRVRRKEEALLSIGNTVKIPRQSNLSTQTKSSGLSNVVLWEAVTEGVQTLTCSTVEYAAFLAEDPAVVQMNQDVVKKNSDKIGYALSRGREVTLAALVASLSQFVGTLNVPLSLDDYMDAHKKILLAGLLNDNMSANENFSIFLSGEEWINALKIDQLQNRDYGEGDALRTARIGKILSYEVYVSLLLTANSSGHDNLMMHRDCFSLAVQKLVPVRSSFIIENIGTGYVGWNLYGTAEMNFPPETMGGGAAVDNRGVWLKGQ